MKRRLKKNVSYFLYGLVFVSVFGALFSIENATSPSLKNDENNYVNKTIIKKEDIPVVAINNTIKRPYNDENMTISCNYYDMNDENSIQENSIIFYEDTYLQSSGVCYSNGTSFDVLSILDGTVSKVEENNLLGNIVEVDHGNGIVAFYQSLSEVMVNTGDKIKQGSIIGKAGSSNILSSLGDHLSFELSIDGKLVNPQNYYDKVVGEIKEQ